MKNIRKMHIVIILLIIISISISPVIGGNDQTINNQSINNKSISNQSIKKQINYRIAIDQYRGFYRVYIANTSGRVVTVSYNGSLYITKGDTITWMNDAVPDARLTIISQQKLWSDNSGVLKWAYKQFSYTFNKSGIYDVYIKENSKLKQKIIVGPIESGPANTTKTNSSSNYKNVSKPGSSNITNKNNTPKMANVSIVNVSKVTNSDNLTNTSKSDEKKNERNSAFVILPIAAIISIMYIKRFQKKVK